MNAAVANVVYHATEKRIRDLPIRSEKLLKTTGLGRADAANRQEQTDPENARNAWCLRGPITGFHAIDATHESDGGQPGEIAPCSIDRTLYRIGSRAAAIHFHIQRQNDLTVVQSTAT